MLDDRRIRKGYNKTKRKGKNGFVTVNVKERVSVLNE